MMKSSLDQGRQVTVVGAGFSGLASAYFLERAGFQVSVIEESSRAGGMISTVVLPEGRVETAANAFLNTALIEQLFHDLDLPLEAPVPEARKRYILRDGRPRRWPLGFGGTLALLKVLFFYLINRARLRPLSGESVQAWGNRVLGPTITSTTVEAALQGIYAGDPLRMSATLLFGRFFVAKKKAGSPPARPKIRGSVSAAEGMGQVIEKLTAYLVGRGVKFEFNKQYVFSNETPEHPVVLAVRADQAAKLLAPLSPDRAQKLTQIEMISLVTTTAFFSSTDLKSVGFGVLFAPAEKRRALGVLKNNFIFADRVWQGFSETWILGGVTGVLPEAVRSRAGGVCGLSDPELLNVIRSERKMIFRLDEAPRQSFVTRWPQALPHYTVELEKLVPSLQTMEKNVILIGNYLGQIGLTKIFERASHLPQEILENNKKSR